MAHGRDVDLEPREHMLFVRARAQIPGTFGKIGAKIGEYGINISQVSVGVTGPGSEPHAPGLGRVAEPQARGL
jgi:hypothetical protein